MYPLKIGKQRAEQRRQLRRRLMCWLEILVRLVLRKKMWRQQNLVLGKIHLPLPR
jgi:cell division protein FtsB